MSAHPDSSDRPAEEAPANMNTALGSANLSSTDIDNQAPSGNDEEEINANLENSPHIVIVPSTTEPTNQTTSAPPPTALALQVGTYPLLANQQQPEQIGTVTGVKKDAVVVTASFLVVFIMLIGILTLTAFLVGRERDCCNHYHYGEEEMHSNNPPCPVEPCSQTDTTNRTTLEGMNTTCVCGGNRGDKLYDVNRETITWTQHFVEAQQQNCELATVSDDNERDLILSELVKADLPWNYNHGLAWLGLIRLGTNGPNDWGWVDSCGPPFSGKSWTGSEPTQGRDEVFGAMFYADQPVGHGNGIYAGGFGDVPNLWKLPAIYTCCMKTS